MLIFDTNVISEFRKGPAADAGVRKFWKKVDPDSVYLTVQTIGEIRSGVEKIVARGENTQAVALERWLTNLTNLFADRILHFDIDCAQVWGKLMAANKQHPVDRQIAAIALIHDMTVVTRNIDDFAETGVRLINPFTPLNPLSR